VAVSRAEGVEAAAAQPRRRHRHVVLQKARALRPAAAVQKAGARSRLSPQLVTRWRVHARGARAWRGGHARARETDEFLRRSGGLVGHWL
jgi:hypothetical protein